MGDEIRYIVIQNGESASVLKSRAVNSNQEVYGNKWTATEQGTYKLKVSAYKNGLYLTHVTATVIIENPFKMAYTILEDSQTYSVGDDVKMHVKVSGDITEADEIQFVVKSEDGNSQIDKVESVDPLKFVYYNKWVPSEPGLFILKAKAFNEGVLVTTVVVNITVVKN